MTIWQQQHTETDSNFADCDVLHLPQLAEALGGLYEINMG